jgi:hypothetical protein
MRAVLDGFRCLFEPSKRGFLTFHRRILAKKTKEKGEHWPESGNYRAWNPKYIQFLPIPSGFSGFRTSFSGY